MSHQWRNLLENNQKPPAALGDFIGFLRGMKIPPNSVAEAALDDPIFGNSFDGMELDSGREGTKGVIQSKFCLEFVSLCERQGALPYSNLDDSFVALWKYCGHVDDLLEGDANKANVNEYRKAMYPKSRCAIRITIQPHNHICEWVCGSIFK